MYNSKVNVMIATASTYPRKLNMFKKNNNKNKEAPIQISLGGHFKRLRPIQSIS